MSEVKNVETIDVEETEDDVVEELESERFLSKVKAGLKKHGKAVAVIAACTVGGMIGYALGNKKNGTADNEMIPIEYSCIEQDSDSASESSEVTED